jgi:hypothetical protein
MDLPRPTTARHRWGASWLLILLVLFILGLLIVALARQERRPPVRRDSTTSSGAVQVTPPSGDGLPVLARKPVPVSPGFEGCPATGDGGDPVLNRLKNRIDSAAWIPVAFDDVLELRWPENTVRRRLRRQWRAADAREVARYEGIPISVEGYLAAARQSGPESTNCHGAAARMRDWHLWLAPEPGRERRRAIIAEPTPATRAMNPRWTLAVMRRLVRDSTRVRISGWLLLDTEHPEEVGRTRGTIWEIHPVMRIEARRGNRWVDISSTEK